MRSIAAVLVALPVLMAAAPAATAVPTTDSPAVSVAVSDGAADAATGDRLRYVVQVENAGTHPFSGSVTLRAPDFVTVEASDAAGEGNVVTWSVEVPAGGSAQWDAAATVGDVPGDAYQVVVLAEVVDERGSVVVRAADADAIPGAQEPPAVPGLAGESTRLPEWVLPAGIVAAIVLTGSALAIVGALLGRRSRSRIG